MNKYNIDMTHFSEIFKHDSDWYKWDKHIEFAKVATEIDEEYREKLIDIYTFLKEELGKGFLKNHYHSEHPLCKQMELIKGDYAVVWVVWFGNSLRDLKNTSFNYERLKKVVSGVESSIREGIPFLELGSAALLCGFDVNFLEEDKKTPMPDIQLTNRINGEKVFIEVSITEELNDSKKNTNLYHKLISLFLLNLPKVGFSGKLLRYPKDKEGTQLFNQLYELRHKVFEEKTFEILSNDIIEIGLTHSENIDEWEVWRKSKKYRFDQIISLPINYDLTKKIRDIKIPEKIDQIPIDGIGIIYLHVPFLYMLLSDSLKTINEVKRRIESHPNIFGIIITGTNKLGAEGGDDRQEYGFSFSEAVNFKDIIDQKIFVFNDKCNPLSPDTTLKLCSLVNSFPSFQY